jgi:2-oxoglutarate dehydrogenase E1 component
LLSEYAVLGFEYGYALAQPDSLVIWEAQFGDFANGAQTIIDQFIFAGESKWQRQNGLVMLLPHGFEGQGPEHSSARMERFLQGCAENNITVANVTTPANLFHLLRRQLERPFRKPLVVMSPKSLLRHPLVVSDISEFETGKRFQEVIDDPNGQPEQVKKVLFCSGKVYYDLLAKQKAENRYDVAVVRVEQLYPFPKTQVRAILKKYDGTACWVQEEPANMGAWMYIASFQSSLRLRYVGRPASASPATGFMSVHQREQTLLLSEAFEV